MSDGQSPPIEIDYIIIVCKGCRGERTIYDVPLHGAQELIEWLKTKPTRCGCGADTCDIKAHVKNATAAGLIGT
jgi:hypothetical protein